MKRKAPSWLVLAVCILFLLAAVQAGVSLIQHNGPVVGSGLILLAIVIFAFLERRRG